MSTLGVKEPTMSVTMSNSAINKALKSYTMSKRYINTMLRASLINILYQRVNMEKKEFLTKTFNDIPFKTFKPKSKNRLIKQFQTFMIASKDAIDKNYLRGFYLYFIDSSTNEILENYKFSFNYSDKDDEKISQNELNLTESTCDLLETLNDLGRHPKLANDIRTKVEFTYLEDTPIEYEPPGFRGINESESLMDKLNKKGNSVIIGELFTGFHTLKCRGRGQIFNFNDSENLPTDKVGELEQCNKENDSNVIEVENESVQDPNDKIMTEDLSQVIEIATATSDVDNISSVLHRPNFNNSYISEYIEIDDNDSELFEINCPCELPVSLGGWTPDIIKCQLCNRNFHAPCYGYLDKTFLEGSFHCHRCKDDSQSIINLFGNQTQTSKPIYRIRYIVGCVYNLSKIPGELQSLFQPTIDSLKSTFFDRDQKKIKEEVLRGLFKFNNKSPDNSKLIMDK